MARYGGGRRGGVREAASLSGVRRREKAPEKRTGEVCPALGLARAGNQAREPRRRKGAPARRRYARKRVPLAGQAGGGEKGTKGNEMRWRDDIQDAEGRSDMTKGSGGEARRTITKHDISGGEYDRT